MCGASSVGKTTLANDWCSKHKDYHHIQEIARDIMRRKGITREDLLTSLDTEDMTLFFDLQCHIMEEQNQRELATCGEPFISDRGPDPLVYVYERMGQEGLDRLLATPATTECLQRYRESLVVVLCPLPMVTDDGFRMVPKKEEQYQFARDSGKLLNQCNIPYIYMDVTDRWERLAYLERAANAEIPARTGKF